MKGKHKISIVLSIILLVTTLFAFNVSAAATIEQNEAYSSFIQELSEEAPLSNDAAIYASRFGVTINDGIRRLALQIPIGKMDGKLTENEVETFAGLWIEHEPEFKVVALFTKNGEETIKSYLSPEFSDIIEVRSADTSLAELVKIQEETTLSVEKLGLHVESEVNVYENRVKIYVLNREKLDSAIQDKVVVLPEKVDIETIETPSTKDTTIRGGEKLTWGTSFCTTGFGVVDGGGTRGITTAEHCSDYQLYNGVSLTYIYGTIGQNYDIQWHTVPAGYSITNQIQYDVGQYRQITSTQSRNDQAIGTIVYKFGVTTNQTVGQIESKTFDPGYGYSGTFIHVDNIYVGQPLSKGGDSGGPWFVNNTAYGSHVGSLGPSEDELFEAYYMAVNYIPNGAGVNVLTSP